jgi:peptidoglycan-associated lipoprotein
MRPTAHFTLAKILWAAGLVLGLLVIGGCGPKYPKCSKDSHCEEQGEVCVDGMCQQCRDDSNCAAGQTCKGGRCEAKSECSSNADCKDNKVCKSGKCQTECSADGDCGSGMKCSDNRCVDQLSCNDNSDCKGGMSCISGRCAQPMAASSGRCEYGRVNFGFNESNLTEAAKSQLNSIAECLKSREGTVTIEGHADERGTEEYNLALGDSRANAVRKYLERLGVPSARLKVVSKGENEPLVNASNEEAWSQNRRAEFIER